RIELRAGADSLGVNVTGLAGAPGRASCASLNVCPLARPTFGTRTLPATVSRHASSGQDATSRTVAPSFWRALATSLTGGASSSTADGEVGPGVAVGVGVEGSGGSVAGVRSTYVIELAEQADTLPAASVAVATKVVVESSATETASPGEASSAAVPEAA